MFKGHAHRLATTFFVVVALLFSQLVLASYVCPQTQQVTPQAMADMGMGMDMDMAAGEPCEGMSTAGMPVDQQQPVLCHQHCLNGAQTFDPVHVPVVSLPAVVQVLVVSLLLDTGAAESVVFAHAGRERPPPAPLFLSTLRLRV